MTDTTYKLKQCPTCKHEPLVVIAATAEDPHEYEKCNNCPYCEVTATVGKKRNDGNDLDPVWMVFENPGNDDNVVFAIQCIDARLIEVCQIDDKGDVSFAGAGEAWSFWTAATPLTPASWQKRIREAMDR